MTSSSASVDAMDAPQAAEEAAVHPSLEGANSGGNEAAAPLAESTSEPPKAMPAVNALPVELAGSDLTASWYIQDAQSRETLGPYTVPELCVRWRKDELDGLSRMWRSGLQSWTPLAEVPDLKAALQSLAGCGKTEDKEKRGVKRGRRPSLDEVPLYHTYTNQEGVLFVFDVLEDDWKVSEVYEALVAEDEALHEEEKKLKGDGKEEEKAIPEDALEFIQECLADASILPGAGAPTLSARPRAAAALAAKVAPVAAAVAAAAAAAAPAAGGDAAPMSEEKAAKAQKRKEYRERKKLKKQAGMFIKTQENPNVYISGLPPDITAEELEQLVKRAGVLKVDPDTGDSRVRVYMDEQGRCKGDALVTYANVASVELAIEFLHEFEVRPDCRIAVQQADFEDEKKQQGPKLSKAELKAAAAARGPAKDLRARYLAAKNLEKEAVSWSGDMDDGTGRRTVVLKHMFSLQEANGEGPQFYTDLAEEVREECAKIGAVVKVKPLERHRLGIVCVKFKSSGEAEECIRVMDGRFFGGRTVEASFHDGKTDLMAVGAVNAPPPQAIPTQEAAGVDARDVAGDASAEVSPAVAEEPQSGPMAKTFEEELDEQSSDSDDDLRVRCEE
mmetsp:Transcript_52236/g.117640  ORF Transcript_52236/g.117640 Transcript_52236/m.117640 type:complete len:616 (+) Transcript_52236:39-1886(+)